MREAGQRLTSFVRTSVVQARGSTALSLQVYAARRTRVAVSRNEPGQSDDDAPAQARLPCRRPMADIGKQAYSAQA
jgi:hypothetical protein